MFFASTLVSALIRAVKERSPLILPLLLSTCFALDFEACLAQPAPDQFFKMNDPKMVAKPIPPEGRPIIAESLGVSVDDPLIDMLQMNRGPSIRSEKLLKDPKLFKHFRGKEGIELPTQEELNRPVEMMTAENAPSHLEKAALAEIERLRSLNSTEQSQKEYDQALEKMLANQRAEFAKEVEVPLLERCQDNATQKEKVADQDQIDRSSTMDYLVLGSEIPADAIEAFGKGVLIFEYKAEKGDSLSKFLADRGVPCLPFRVRVVGNTIYWHRGIDALKNYEGDASGKGVLTEVAKVRLEKLLAGGR